MAIKSKFHTQDGIKTLGNAEIDGSLTVSGNFTVNGEQTIIDSTTQSVTDSMIELASGNTTSDTIDVGIYGNYNDGLSGEGDVSEYTGLFRDATDSTWKLYDGLEVEPTTTVNTSGSGFTLADLQVGDLTATTLTATNSITGSSITYPTTDGTNGQVITTNGSGTLSFGDIPAGYADSDVESYLSGGTGVTYSSGAISIGQAVATSDSPTFANMTLSGTDSIKISSGTTAQRNVTPTAGMFRYNTTTGEFEGYTDEWGAIGGGGGSFTTDIFAGDGADTTFTVSSSVSNENNLMVFIDGVFQAQDSYSVSGTTLTFSTAPANGRVITVYHAKAVSIGTPSDNSVDTVQLVDGAVTSAKLDTNIAIAGTLGVTGAVDMASTLTMSAGGTISAGGVNDLVLNAGASGTPDIYLQSGGATKVKIEGSNGNVGIGTSTPLGDLSIGSNGNASGGNIQLGVDTNNANKYTAITSKAYASDAQPEGFITIASQSYDGGNDTFIGGGFGELDASTGIRFYTAATTNTATGTERLRIDSSGNVGIGTNSPTFSAGGGLNVAQGTFATIRARGGASTGVDFAQASDGKGYVYVRDNADLLFGTNNAERLRISSAGEVSINTTSTGGTLNVLATGSDTANWCQRYFTTGTANELYIVDFMDYQGQRMGYITGNAVGNTVAYQTSSDYRLKENVDYTWDATTRLKQLKPARFNWIRDESNTLVDGFLAHEVEDIVPEAISGEKDATETKTNAVVNSYGNYIADNVTEEEWLVGKEDGTYDADTTWAASHTQDLYQGIDQAKLVPLLVKTIQELEARITTLENA